MNFRLTAVFFLLVVAMVIALLVSVITDSDSDVADGLVSELTRAALKDKDVDTVEITRTQPTQERLVLVKTAAGKWEAREPVTAKVDSFAIDGIVRDLFRAKPVRDPEAGQNLTVRGLDSPSVQLTLKAGADKSSTVNIGTTTIGGDRAVTYVSTGAAPKRPLAIKRSDLASLFRDAARSQDGAAFALVKWLPDLRNRRLLASDVGDAVTEAKAVKITAGGKEVALSRASGGAWEFTTPAGWADADVAGDTEARPNTAALTGVRPLLNLLTGLQAGSVTDFIEQPGDLAKYGLNPGNPNIVRVELTTAAGTEVLSLSGTVEENGKPVVPTKVYAQLSGDPAVVKVQTDRLEALRQTAMHPSELRNKDLIASEKRDRIDAIDLTVGTTTVKLRKVPAGPGALPGQTGRWVMYGEGGAADVKAAEVEAVLTAFTKSRAVKDVLPAPDDAAFSGPEVKATVKLWVDGVEKPKDEKKDEKKDATAWPPEPKVNGTPVTLVFGKREADAVLVRKTADGKSVDLKLPDAVLTLVTKSRLDLIDPKLKSFDTGAAVKLTFHRGKDKFELTKKPAGGWNLAKPGSAGGQSADAQKVSGLLGLLAGLFPEKVVAENPPDPDLPKWGLGSAAALTVTVEMKDGPDKQLVYEFGTAADADSVFARQVGRPIVFTVPKTTLERFQKDDLRDRTLFTLDLAKVQKVKLRGWAGLLGAQPLEYVVKREGGGWTAVSPPTPAGFTPDAAKVTALLTSLAAPRADAFVDVADKPQYGLSPDTASTRLEITVERDGGPPVTLVLGGPAEGGKVYAMSSAVPGEVFTLDATRIRAQTEKPAALQK